MFLLTVHVPFPCYGKLFRKSGYEYESKFHCNFAMRKKASGRSIQRFTLGGDTLQGKGMIIESSGRLGTKRKEHLVGGTWAFD